MDNTAMSAYFGQLSIYFCQSFCINLLSFVWSHSFGQNVTKNKSGERKSSVDHAFSQAVRQWEQHARNKLEPKVQLAKTRHQTWFAEKTIKQGELGVIRMVQAGVKTVGYSNVIVEMLKDNANPLAAEVYSGLDMPFAGLVYGLNQYFSKK
jgi:hypothetical protein